MKKLSTSAAKAVSGGIAPLVVAAVCIGANAVAWARAIRLMR